MSTPLFDNAVDSLRHGVSYFLIRHESNTAIKHAVLNIHHSIELFLKERLARVHPILIYRYLDRPISDDSQTVGLTEVLQRLENAGMPVPAEQQKALIELQRRRNRIEHHRFDPSEDHVLFAGQAMKFLLEFLPAALDTTLEDLIEESADYQDVLEAALSYQERVRHATTEAEKHANVVTTCPNCGEETLAVSDLWGHCYLCNEDTELGECARCEVEWPSSDIDASGLCPYCRNRLNKLGA